MSEMISVPVFEYENCNIVLICLDKRSVKKQSGSVGGQVSILVLMLAVVL